MRSEIFPWKPVATVCSKIRGTYKQVWCNDSYGSASSVTLCRCENCPSARKTCMAGFLVRFELTFANLFTEFALMKGESFLKFGIQKLTRQKCPRIVYVHSFISGRSDRVGGGIEIFNCWKNTPWSSHVWLQGRLAMQCANHREPSADGPFPGICDSGASCSSMKVLDLSPSSLSFFGVALVYHSA